MKVIVLSALLILGCSVISAKDLPLDTVEYVDLIKYSGRWFEIARIDQSFQKGCTAVEANYIIRKDGDIDVINSCRLGSPDGEFKSGTARAWVKDKKSNAKLKVQFFLKKIKLNLFAGDYWIIDLADDYSYAMVGDPSRKYFWILSRTKNMDDHLYDELIARARSWDFPVEKVIKTIH